MKLLLDTHVLLWAAGQPTRLSPRLRASIEDPANGILFSAASLWEIASKRSLENEQFHIDVRVLRRGLIDNGYSELPVGGEHVVAIEGLPPIHTDPFDRILLAQAQVEGITLVTADPTLAKYPGPVQLV